MEKKSLIIINLMAFLFTASLAVGRISPITMTGLGQASAVYYVIQDKKITVDLQVGKTEKHRWVNFAPLITPVEHVFVAPGDLYVYYDRGAHIYAVNVLTHATPKTESIPGDLRPAQMVATKDGDYVYTLLKNSSSAPVQWLGVINTAKLIHGKQKMLTLIPLNAPGVSIAITSIRTENKEKTAASLNQYLLVMDTAGDLEIIKLGKTPSENQALTPLPLSQNLGSITVGPNSQYAYVTHKAPDEKTISVIDLSKLLSEPRQAKLQPIQLTSPVSPNNHHIAISQSGRYVYIATTSGIEVYKMAGSPLTPIPQPADILPKKNILSLAVDPESQYLYALWRESAAVDRVDAINMSTGVITPMPAVTGTARAILMPPPAVYIQCPAPPITLPVIDTAKKSYNLYGPAEINYINSTYNKTFRYGNDHPFWYVKADLQGDNIACTYRTSAWSTGGGWWTWPLSTVTLLRTSSVEGLPNHYIKNFDPNGGAGFYNVNDFNNRAVGVNNNESYAWWTGYNNVVPTVTLKTSFPSAEYEITSTENIISIEGYLTGTGLQHLHPNTSVEKCAGKVCLYYLKSDLGAAVNATLHLLVKTDLHANTLVVPIKIN